ncbi:MAG TPA: hypothetical protein PLJ60_01980 [Chryseolinea sp.]|nr:hypothetical protein [Chryseolinea sp.]HPM29078.1 hypothetical protein [Chryseolinea sp.]
MKFLNYFNIQTFLGLVISQIAAFLAIHFQIKFHMDLLLFSLCVVFPLHFSMQAAFKRRDKALEFFSLFKGGSMALHYSFQVAEDLPAEKKQEANDLLKGMVSQLIDQLENRKAAYEPLQLKLNRIFSFIEMYRDEISKRNVLRMVRYLKDVTEGSVYLISLVNHRTMGGLRFYSIFFIIIFPLIQAPIVLYRLDSLIPTWGIYVFLALTSLILVTLRNFQAMIEYPFDSRGMDNINLREFSLDIDARVGQK